MQYSSDKTQTLVSGYAKLFMSLRAKWNVAFALA